MMGNSLSLKSKCRKAIQTRSVLAAVPLSAIPVAGFSGAMAPAGETRPNVIIIQVDDLNHEAGFLGYEPVRTPRLDQFAQRGVVFSNSHCQYAVCHPSRTSSLSGLRPETTGIVDNITPPNQFIPDLRLIQEDFADQGYATYGLGKVVQTRFTEWASRGFDQFTSQGPSPRLYENYEMIGNSRPQGFFYYTGDEELLPTVRGVRTAIDYLNQAAGAPEPFYLYWGLVVPHFNRAVPSRFWEMYPAEEIPIPLEPTPEQLEMISRSSPWQHWRNQQGYPEEEFIDLRRGYYACITFMDEVIGQLFDEMTRLGLWENTIVVFYSDHGQSLSRWTIGKGSVWRLGSYSPLLIHAPGVAQQGRICDAPVELLDIYPTLMELTGLPVAERLEGVSLVPLLENPDAEWNRTAHTISVLRATQEIGRAVSCRDYRYIEWEVEGVGPALYNIRNDPEEYNNLAENPEYADTIRDLRSRIIKSEHALFRADAP